MAPLPESSWDFQDFPAAPSRDGLGVQLLSRRVEGWGVATLDRKGPSREGMEGATPVKRTGCAGGARGSGRHGASRLALPRAASGSAMAVVEPSAKTLGSRTPEHRAREPPPDT